MKEDDCRIAPKGKYRIVCVDKFYPPGGSTEVVEDCEDKEFALKKARFMTKKCMKNTSSYDIAQVFYVYDDKGKYLGGDTWVNE